jgi:hypothetical protein
VEVSSGPDCHWIDSMVDWLPVQSQRRTSGVDRFSFRWKIHIAIESDQDCKFCRRLRVHHLDRKSTRHIPTTSDRSPDETLSSQAIPGVLEYEGARIQLLDLPGIVEGAAMGRGRGRQVISVAKTADVIIIMSRSSCGSCHAIAPG